MRYSFFSPASSVSTLGLLPGERVLWSGYCDGYRGQRITLEDVLVIASIIGALLSAAGFALYATNSLPEKLPAQYALVACSLLAVCALMAMALIVRGLRINKRHVFFVTPGRVLERALFGNRVISLEGVRSAHRQVLTHRSRWGGLERVSNDCVDLRGQPDGRWFGPTRDADRVCDLIDLLVSGQVDPRDLPAVVGERSTAEQRTDILLARTHRIDGMDFGLLFIGPACVIRFAERLPLRIEARLFQNLATAKDANEAEAAVQAMSSHPESGYAQRLERAKAHPHFEDDALILRRDQGQDRIELLKGDREHFHRVLAVHSTLG